MTKTMQMFLQLRDTGVAVNLQNLDELYEKEFADRMEMGLALIQDEVKRVKAEILGVDVAGWDNERRKQTVEYCFGRVDSLLRRRMRPA